MAWDNGHTRTSTPQHKRWVRQVLTRDQYTCQRCGHQGHARDGNMQADHIINIKAGGEPTDLNNGQTLCKPCHARKTSQEGVQARKDRNAPRPTMRHPALG